MSDTIPAGRRLDAGRGRPLDSPVTARGWIEAATRTLNDGSQPHSRRINAADDALRYALGVLDCPDAPTPTPAEQRALHDGALVAGVRETGCAVEIGGVRIHPCDEYGNDLTRPSAPAIEQMTDVLVAHQRMGAHSCLCGDLPLGSSFAQHQAEQIAAIEVSS